MSDLELSSDELADPSAVPAPVAQPYDAPVAVALEPLHGGQPISFSTDLQAVLDVPVELTVEIGRTMMTIAETLTIGPGSIISLGRATGEPVDLLVNGKRIARGEVVAIDEEFGLRVTEVDSPESPFE
jgi:flagellar motor switch protein FliN/FliY